MDPTFQIPQMAPPPLMHPPPPQIFGSYGADGLPMIGHLGDLNAQAMFLDGGNGMGMGGLMEDSHEAKRRRIARVRISTWLQGRCA